MHMDRCLLREMRLFLLLLVFFYIYAIGKGYEYK